MDRSYHKVFLAILALILSSYITAYSSWSNDPTINVPVCVADFDQTGIRGIEDGNGGVILVWEDCCNYDLSKIYAQRLDANGDILWEVNGVSLTANALGNQTSPAIISDDTGGAIVSWVDERNLTDQDIYAQRLDAEGNLLWGENGIPIINVERDQYNICMVADGEGGANLIWIDKRRFHYGYYPQDLYAQRLDASGNTMWDAKGVVICNSRKYQLNPQVISDNEGGILVTWSGSTIEPFSTIIYCQHINAYGVPQWNATGVQVIKQDQPHPQKSPRIISDNNGGVIIGCEYFISHSIEYPPRFFIQAQKIDVSGSTIWGDMGVNIAALKPADPMNLQIDLVSDQRSGAILVWKFGYYSDGDYYAQRIDQDGNLLWNPDGQLVGGDKNYLEQGLQVVSDQRGGFIATWTDRRMGEEYDIYAQHLDAGGNMIWNTAGVPICMATGNQENPCIISTGIGEAVIAWVDTRNEITTNKDIYAQKVFEDGSLPVILSYFYASLQNDSILLEWGTESEQDNLGWNIYRSDNPRTGFCKINAQLIPGAGNTSTPTNYNNQDNAIQIGYTYTYYLESIDYSGNTHAYQTISILIE